MSCPFILACSWQPLPQLFIPTHSEAVIESGLWLTRSQILPLLGREFTERKNCLVLWILGERMFLFILTGTTLNSGWRNQKSARLPTYTLPSQDEDGMGEH